MKEKIWQVYISLNQMIYAGMGDSQSEEIETLKEVICELYNYPEEEFNKLMDNLIYIPCKEAYQIQDYKKCFEKQVEIINSNFPIILDIIQKER